MHQAASAAAPPSASGRRACVTPAAPLLALLLAACGGEAGPDAAAPAAEPVWHADATAQPQTGQHGGFAVRELATGLVHPWGLAFLPDGGLLVTERPGRLRRIGADGVVSPPLAGVPDVFTPGQSGLLDVALSPGFAQDSLVYLAYGEPNWRGNKGGTAVARGRLGADGLDDVEVVFRQEPKLSNGTHLGARLLFDRNGFLFVTAGDSRSSGTAQLLDHLQGKLVRINADGSVPADNPFVGRDGARPEIWSYGHRNAQGLALHPDTGRVWLHEHGPRGGDEINVPQAGRNYGWPVITHGLEYSGQPVPEATGSAAPGMEQPVHWGPVSPGVSGMAFYTGAAFPQWQGDLFIGALATRELIRLELDGERVVHDERLLADRGERIRDVRQGPDGLLYLLTDDPNGKLLQLAPR
jgi:glucose/arabinose dehydrogenase